MRAVGWLVLGGAALCAAPALPPWWGAPAGAAAQQGRDLEPWKSGWNGLGEHEHLILLLGFRGEVTTHDSVLIEFRLAAREQWRVHFAIAEGEGPRLVLTPRGKKPRSKPLLVPLGVEQFLLNHSPLAPDGVLYSFGADLRAYFGKLGAGEYEIAVVLPAKAYELKGVPGFKNSEVKAAGRFTVLDATLADAKKGTPAREVMITRDKGLFPEAIPTGALTNRLNQPILLRVRPAEDGRAESALKPPLRLEVLPQRWHPKAGWVFLSDEAAPSSDDWPTVVLAPGKSVSVVLPEWDLEGDGIYRFGVSVYEPRKASAPGLTVAGTEAFLYQARTRGEKKD